ncbi:MAG: endolytic transglycosylase MltG [bacterium]|nr:endolytic transglycosylase MltG [bacterium]
MAKIAKYKYIVAMSGLLLILPTYLLYTGKSPTPDKFTTNIDLENKVINDVIIDESYDGVTLPILHNFLEDGQKWLSSNFNVWKFYQNLASPTSRYIVLSSGLRKEEVANILKKNLKWNDSEKYAFINMDKTVDKKNMEGRYHPGSYLMPAGTKPTDAYKFIMNKFKEDVSGPYASSTANIINMDLALKIASIIEREAAGTKDMRLISGIIWNRIFTNMNLEMDATLQYAKGNNRVGWWPKVAPKDKYINSPYNTYRNGGLPPTPISNVSIATLQAALNPKKTECIFYIHDKHSLIHCAVTYKDHLANIKKYYGK